MFFFFHIYHLIWSYNKPQYLSLASLVRGDCYVNRGWWFPQLPINHICWSPSATKPNYCSRNEVRGWIFPHYSCTLDFAVAWPPCIMPWFTAHMPDLGNNQVFKDSKLPKCFQPKTLQTWEFKCSKIQNRRNVFSQKPCRHENSSSVMEGTSSM